MFGTITLALALVTILLRLLAPRSRPASLLADLALALASATVLVAVADPAAWSNALLLAPDSHAKIQPMDARLPSHLALVAAVLATIPSLVGPGAGGPQWIGVLLPGALAAAAVTASLSFIGLRDALALGAAAAGAFAGGAGLGGLVRSLGSAGSTRGRALLALASAAVAVATTLALFGLRTDPAPVLQDESTAAGGYGLAYRGLADTTRNPVRLLVELQQGMKLREYRPSLERRGDAVVGRTVGEWLGGPVLGATGWNEEPTEAHPFAWVAKGDSLRVRDAVLTFRGFRSEKAEGVRFYADLDVARAGTVTRVSPGLSATSAGSTPFAAEIPGMGPVAVARMDADGGRVALMMAGLEAPPARSIATLRMQMRPGLEVAWGAIALVAIGLLLALTARTADDRRAA